MSTKPVDGAGKPSASPIKPKHKPNPKVAAATPNDLGNDSVCIGFVKWGEKSCSPILYEPVLPIDYSKRQERMQASRFKYTSKRVNFNEAKELASRLENLDKNNSGAVDIRNKSHLVIDAIYDIKIGRKELKKRLADLVNAVKEGQGQLKVLANKAVKTSPSPAKVGAARQFSYVQLPPSVQEIKEAPMPEEKWGLIDDDITIIRKKVQMIANSYLLSSEVQNIQDVKGRYNLFILVNSEGKIIDVKVGRGNTLDQKVENGLRAKLHIKFNNLTGKIKETELLEIPMVIIPRK